MATITLTRALKEVQALPKKIEKKIQDLNPICVTAAGKPPAGYADVKEYEAEQKNIMKSIDDLMNRQSKMQGLIAIANATHKVKINGEEMTIVEAIKYRDQKIKQKELLRLKLARCFTSAQADQMSMEERLNANIQNILNTTASKNSKVSEADAKAMTEPFRKANEPKMIDPLNIKAKIQNLDDELSDINTEIDLTLSEANASVSIEID